MKRIVFLLSLFISVYSFSQPVRDEITVDHEKAGGVMYAYPGPQSVQTPAPKGYKPFYISHFGRHGSRWHDVRSAYELPYDILKEAHDVGKLTEKGKEVLSKVSFLRDDAHDRVGDLTPLGIRQHQGIARRMFNSFPEAFKGTPLITANSTRSSRVMLSMFYFCDQLKTLNPRISISMDASGRDVSFVANRNEESVIFEKSERFKEDLEGYTLKCYHTERLMNELFNDANYVESNVDTVKLYESLYELGSIAQDNELTEVDLLGIFEDDELFDIWQKYNYWWYATRGSNPRGGEAMIEGGLPMLKHFLDKADEYIKSGDHGATLRFSHDGFLVPLVTSMRLDGCRGVAERPEECSSVFVNYKISPMAGNVQWVFFKNRKGDVLVKFLLNENELGVPVETDVYPYYHWKDVKDYYETLFGKDHL